MNPRHFSIATCIVVILLLIASSVSVVYHANDPTLKATATSTEKSVNSNSLFSPENIRTFMFFVAVATLVLATPRKSDIDSLKGNIESVKTDLEKDIGAVKSDLEKDIESLKTDLEKDIGVVKSDLEKDIGNNREAVNEANRNFTNHVDGHPSATQKNPHGSTADKSLQEIVTPQEGEFSADEHDKHTGS